MLKVLPFLKIVKTKTNNDTKIVDLITDRVITMSYL